MKKVSNLSVKKEAIALIMAGAVLVTARFMGSTDVKPKNPFPVDTLLEDTVIANVDGNYEVLKQFVPVYCSSIHGREAVHISLDPKSHNHYYNLISGDFLTNERECTYTTPIKDSGSYSPKKIKNPKILGEASEFLSEEELNELLNDELTEEELQVIVSNAIKSKIAKQKILK